MENEIIYNDVFEVSIFDIIRYSRPTNIDTLKNMLDNKGYFGRYDMYYRMKRGKLVEDFRLKIYLPNSKTYYLCPYKGYLKIDDYDLLDKLNKKIPEGSSAILRMAARSYGICSIIDIIEKTSLNYKKATKAITFLHSVGLFKDFKTKLRDEDDLLELSSNILDCK